MSKLVLARILTATAACALLWSGSCFVSYGTHHHHHCDDHHHDDRDDCHDHEDEGPAGDDGVDFGDLTVREFDERVEGDPGSHPTRAVRGVRDVTVAVEALDDPTARWELGAALIEANPALLGLPAWAGELVPAGVEIGASTIELSWVQVRAGEWGVHPVPGGGASALFVVRGDLLDADLVAIENRSRLLE